MPSVGSVRKTELGAGAACAAWAGAAGVGASVLGELAELRVSEV